MEQSDKQTKIFDDGSQYIGDLKDDMPDGKGIYYYPNDERYEGDFKNGLRDGKGIYYYLLI